MHLHHRAGRYFSYQYPDRYYHFSAGCVWFSESADPEKAAFDPAGQLLSIAALGAVTYGLIEAGSRGWLHPVTLSAIIGDIILSLVFLVTESRGARPLLPLSDFKQRDYHQYNMASFVIGFSTYTNIFFIALFLQKAQGWNALEAGWRMLPEFIAMAVFSFSFGLISRTFSIKQIPGTALILMAGAALSAAWVFILIFYPRHHKIRQENGKITS